MVVPKTFIPSVYEKYEEMWKECKKIGLEAGEEIKPVPMVVEQRESPFDDTSPVQKQWLVDDGVCGFAWLKIKSNTPENKKFISAMRKLGILSSDINERKPKIDWHKSTYEGGFIFWIHWFNQSMQRKERAAHAMSAFLQEKGITAYAMSRMD